MSCFWTDFAGCVEDCGDAPPSTYDGRALFSQGFAGEATGNGFRVRLYENRPPNSFPFDGQKDYPPSMSIVSGTLYVADEDNYSGCSWMYFVAAVNGETTGEAVIVGEGDYTFQPLSTLTAFSGESGQITNPVAVDDDGYYDRAELYASCGFDLGDYSGSYVFVGVVVDNDTGKRYFGSGTVHGCF